MKFCRIRWRLRHVLVALMVSLTGSCKSDPPDNRTQCLAYNAAFASHFLTQNGGMAEVPKSAILGRYVHLLEENPESLLDDREYRPGLDVSRLNDAKDQAWERSIEQQDILSIFAPLGELPEEDWRRAEANDELAMAVVATYFVSSGGSATYYLSGFHGELEKPTTCVVLPDAFFIRE